MYFLANSLLKDRHSNGSLAGLYRVVAPSDMTFPPFPPGVAPATTTPILTGTPGIFRWADAYTATDIRLPPSTIL